MLISSHIYNAANCAIAKNNWQSIFYHFCIMVTIFQVVSSLSIFQQQYLLWHNTENRWKVIKYNHVKSKNHVTKRRFPNYFWFDPPVFQGLFTRWVNNKHMIYESSLLHIFYNIQEYTFIPNFTKRFEIMMAATYGKNLNPPISKRSNDSNLQENQEL